MHAFVEAEPSLSFQYIHENFVKNTRTPSMEEVINEIYREECGEPTINPLA